MHGVVERISISRGGLPKLRIEHASVGPLGVAGDEHAHPRFHGGLRKALLVMTAEGIEELAGLGFPVYAGALGENLTTRGLDRRCMRLGQRYRAGSVVLELTSMRVPCSALDVYGPGIRHVVYDARVKAGDPQSPVWGLGGFYASVIDAGEIRTRDPIALLEQAPRLGRGI